MTELSIVAAVGSLLTLVVRGSRFDRDGLIVAIDLHGPEARLAAGSLVRTAETTTPSRWPALVEAWSAAVLEQLRQPAGTITGDHLRLLLAPRRVVEPSHTMVRAVGAHLQLELMAELPDRRVWVGPSRLGEIGLTADDAWARAVANTEHELGRVTARRHQIGGGFDVFVAARDDCPWVSAGLMSVPAWAGDELPYGALVAVPRRSSVLFTPVRGARVTGEAVVVCRLVAAMYGDAPDPCDPGTYWLLDDAIYPVVVDEAQRVTFPVELQSVVDSLPQIP